MTADLPLPKSFPSALRAFGEGKAKRGYGVKYLRITSRFSQG